MSANSLEPPKPEEVVKELPTANRVILDSALANVVDHARRLKMISVEGVPDLCDKSEETEETPNEPKTSSVKIEVTKPKLGGGTRSRLWQRLQKSERRPQTPRGVQCQTARLPLPPPPPPPSPRCPQAKEICLALKQAEQLQDDYRKTDELVDQLLEQATDMHMEGLLRCQLQRDADLVRDMEVEYSDNYMFIMLEAIRAEFESPDA